MREVILCSGAVLSDGTIIRFARIRSANEKSAGPAHNELAATDTRDGKLIETVRMRTESITLQSSMDDYVKRAVAQLERELAKISDRKLDPVQHNATQVVDDYAAFAMALRRRPVKEEKV